MSKLSICGGLPDGPCHLSARLTLRDRAAVFIAEAGMTVVAACLAFNVSGRCYCRWLPRWQRGFCVLSVVAGFV